MRGIMSDWWHAIEVTAIGDWWSGTGLLERSTHTHTVRMDSLKGMVDNVLAELGTSDNLSRLNIAGHGDTSAMEFGSDVLNETNVDAYASQWWRLRGHFARDGFVFLAGCEVGNNLSFVIALAKILGVRVVAGKGYQNNFYHVNTGDYVFVEPNGSWSQQFWGPGWGKQPGTGTTVPDPEPDRGGTLT